MVRFNKGSFLIFMTFFCKMSVEWFTFTQSKLTHYIISILEMLRLDINRNIKLFKFFKRLIFSLNVNGKLFIFLVENISKFLDRNIKKKFHFRGPKKQLIFYENIPKPGSGCIWTSWIPNIRTDIVFQKTGFRITEYLVFCQNPAGSGYPVQP